MSCGKKLSPGELFPILSFLLIRGKCKSCGSKLSPVYLYSETLSGALVAIAYVVATSLPFTFLAQLIIFLVTSFVICLSMIIIIYDIRHTIVPVEVVSILIATGLFLTAVRAFMYGFNAYDILSGVIVAAPFAILYAVSKGKWLGMGDILVYVAFGFILGLPFGITMFLYSVWLGAFVAVLLMIFHGDKYGMKSEMPFTPFIIIAALLVWYTQTDILNLHEIIY
jgi:leader peptidase (prepilin peptidase)/N-methyltransferase